MKTGALPHRIVLLLVTAFVSIPVGGSLAERKDDIDSANRGMVLPAPRPPNPQVSSQMSAKASGLLEDLGYDLVTPEATKAILRRANPSNVQACVDKSLIAIGRAVKADLVVCPRMVNQPRPMVRVTFARVSKRRVWDCLRPVSSKDGLTDDDYVQAVEFCMDQLLSSDPKTGGKARAKKKIIVATKRARSRKNHLGAAALLVPAGMEKFIGNFEGNQRLIRHFKYDFSWGAGVFYERRNLSWVSVGVAFDWYSLGKKKKKASETDGESEAAVSDNTPGQYLPGDLDRLNIFNLGATLRLFYPGRWVEPYLKIGIGVSVGTDRDGDLFTQVDTGAGAGANYQVRAGLMAIVSYLGIFVELGYVDILWFPNTEAWVVFDSAIHNEALLALNLGLAAVF